MTSVGCFKDALAMKRGYLGTMTNRARETYNLAPSLPAQAESKTELSHVTKIRSLGEFAAQGLDDKLVYLCYESYKTSATALCAP